MSEHEPIPQLDEKFWGRRPTDEEVEKAQSEINARLETQQPVEYPPEAYHPDHPKGMSQK